MRSDDLLAQLCKNPGDDALRQVLGDCLLEAKDPRGELIALHFKQVRGDDSPDDRARIGTLLKKNFTRFLGALAPQVEPESARFDRGFLSRCTLRSEALTLAARAKWLAEPTLPLLRELGFPDTSPENIISVLEEERLSLLPGVKLASSRALTLLAERSQPWSFSSLGLVANPFGRFRALATDLSLVGARPAFAALQRLALEVLRFGRRAMLDLSQMLSRQPGLALRVKELVVRTTSSDYPAFGYGVSVLSTTWPAADITLENEHASVRLSLPARDVHVVGDTGPTPLCSIIAGLHLSGLGRLRADQRDTRPISEGERDALKNDLRRLAPRAYEFPASWGLVDL